MKALHKNHRLFRVKNLNVFQIVKYEMSKYTISGKYVFVSNDSMIAEFSNLMLIISEHDEKYIKKERR